MADLKAAPVLSTPAEHIFDPAEPISDAADDREPPTNDALRDLYEIDRTACEIRARSYRCVALQFPDAMLSDAPRVVHLLREALVGVKSEETMPMEERHQDAPTQDTPKSPWSVPKLYILADTSYAACCIDEVAAEHATADVVVHYGRACLSPTSRLPVIYVFTHHTLDVDAAVSAFVRQFTDPASALVVVMADVTHQDHVSSLAARLWALGYSALLATEVIHDPLGRIPNRRLVDAAGKEVRTVEEGKEGTGPAPAATVDLHNYSIFHVGQPPTALLLALAVRVRSFFIFEANARDLLAPRSQGLLGRRYAKVLSIATAAIIGILVNTLSVRDYLAAVDNLRRRIAAAGKKSYIVVVGKLNPAKLANFAEVDGWVVVGCWESSLVEDDAGFYQPVVTPFELDMALMRDDKRVWGERWWGGLEALVGRESADAQKYNADGHDLDNDYGSDADIPQFDLRTGRLVTTSRPMRQAARETADEESRHAPDSNDGALALRQKAGELASIKGVASPGAEFLRSRRTWQGLGTEFHDADAEPASTAVEEGRSGIARGYTVGDDAERT